MILLTDGWIRWVIALLMVGGGAALCAQEWRRADRRNLPWRFIASALAVSALGLLGLRPALFPAYANRPANGVQAALWTPGAENGGGSAEAEWRQIPTRQRFKLPGVAGGAAFGAAEIPDTAFLRRTYPELQVLHLLGGGLECDELEALRGLAIRFHPAELSDGKPSVAFLRRPVQLALGQSVDLQGELTGLDPAHRYAVTLEGPDGATSQASVAKGADRALFEIQGAPAVAAGKFLWRFRLKADDDDAAGKTWLDEPIGVAMSPPILPRVLMLESRPSFETAHLQRWLGQLGGAWTARTLLGQNRFRYASSGGAAKEFQSLDAALLADFDLVLTDADALTALSAPERAALRAAVAERGLGVLVLGSKRALAAGDASAAPDVASPDFFFPWQIVSTEAASAPTEATGGERTARLVWQGLSGPLENPVAAEAAEIRLASQDQRGLIRDDQGRTLAAATLGGSGQIGVTLVRETWRWRQGADPAAYARHWSFLLSQLARRETDAGRWSIIGGDTEPPQVNRPLHLQYVGAADAAGPAIVTADADFDGQTRLPLAQDPHDPHRQRSTFWPRQAGWHHVALSANEAGLDFFVHPADGWASLRAARVRSATERASIAARSEIIAPSTNSDRPTPLGAGWLFAAFLVSAGYLWIERRFGGA